MHVKLYKLDQDEKKYWEVWDNENGSHTIHWGILGEKGQSKDIKPSFFNSAKKVIKKEIETQTEAGFVPFDDLQALLIEYEVDGFGTNNDLEKRHALQGRMDETLGWTGLGHCDGGSIGSGTMEVCNFVVDAEIAKVVIETDLKDTEFANYTRIFVES